MNDQASKPTFRDLPFIADDAWAPIATGDYAADCRVGRDHAQLMLDMIRETKSPTIYGAVARCVGQVDVWTGIEIGFHQRLAEAML